MYVPIPGHAPQCEDCRNKDGYGYCIKSRGEVGLWSTVDLSCLDADEKPTSLLSDGT